MGIFAIGDLHLSFNNDKPMDIFGDEWKDHHAKIKEDWLMRVKEDDLVIIPGDISWAMSFSEASKDLKWIDELPGRKVLFKGNHDYWWTSKKKMDGSYTSIEFMHNSFTSYDKIAICGTRGWLCPNEAQFDDNDKKIYEREAIRLENSINQAKRLGYEIIIVAMHFPPTNEKKEPSLFTDIFEKYEVKEVVYGHVHSKEYYKMTLQGTHRGINYSLASCDYLNFKLLEIAL